MSKSKINCKIVGDFRRYNAERNPFTEEEVMCETVFDPVVFFLPRGRTRRGYCAYMRSRRPI